MDTQQLDDLARQVHNHGQISDDHHRRIETIHLRIGELRGQINTLEQSLTNVIATLGTYSDRIADLENSTDD